VNKTVKHCKCGQSYSLDAWRRLLYVGVQDDGNGGMLELRNCACLSTISVRIPK
jgi:hypothetical protein